MDGPMDFSSYFDLNNNKSMFDLIGFFEISILSWAPDPVNCSDISIHVIIWTLAHIHFPSSNKIGGLHIIWRYLTSVVLKHVSFALLMLKF